ncbi:MAG: class I SAM-dependent DNA methyltransferase [Bacteroidetes bacterium]|nr:MAG: class I SAM-dependent DNA methyltransferase [Bacteroidota bacterium]MBZ0194166.1 class I SAM-dependent DNA methyltransferase [Candidatus Kapabacteria bacterium]
MYSELFRSRTGDVFSVMLAITDIRTRAAAFADRWKDEASEDAEAKSFWDEFLAVFGVNRKRVAVFEKQVAKAGAKAGYIDLFWPGLLIVEHKSAGKDLSKAFTQAVDYFPGLKDSELPRYVIVSDFQRIRVHDLVDNTETEIHLSELPKRIDVFGFISGYATRKFRDEDPVNVRAAELMGRLHDAIKATGYEGHELEVFLTRLLFCLFGDDTGIFNRDSFVSFLETKTREDGLDVGPQLSFLFQLLNTPPEKRPKNLDEELQAFPYVNGNLFLETLPTPNFDREMRDRLLECANFDWTYVSPAVFGAMFQGVMNAVERRNLGAHYTSEKNILKVVSGLFLDEIEAELAKARNSESRLRALHERISRMRFLDPACGCGNFLIVTYKELRRIETEILKQLDALGKLSGRGQLISDISALSRLSVHSMFGIEIEEFPARIAEVALWLIDHIMNVELASAFGAYFVRLPLTNGPTIRIGDALEVDWRTDVLNQDPDAEWFILGNPPFIGSKMMTESQRSRIKQLFGGVTGSGVMDFVTGWYVKAAQAIRGTTIRCAFVSTNSISQGEQVGILWKHLVQKYGIHIHFAHRTFRWSNEAKGVAAVHCVIVGFGCMHIPNPVLFDYATPTGDAAKVVVQSINGYLTEGEHIFITSRSTPLCNVPEMMFGNMPLDGGNLLLDPEERHELLASTPSADKYVKRCIGAWEFLNNGERYCLWLKGISPSELRSMPAVMKRVEAVKEFRLASIAPSTRDHAVRPWEFRDTRHPDSRYLIVPKVSSETRLYIPVGVADSGIVTTDLNFMIPLGEEFHFGILMSIMHMSWVRAICGRLESRYRYSKDVVYNNYPWPEPTPEQRKKIEELAQNVLDARAHHSSSSLADLYHPTTMPMDLRKAHELLDKAVDVCYRKEPFKSERERVEHLFGMYRSLTEGFGAAASPKNRPKKSTKQ